jgi:neutral ceramidase
VIDVASFAENRFSSHVRAGFATADITPPVGTPMAGYPDVRRDLSWTPDAMKGYVGRRRQVSTGVHDPLLATALAFESGDSRAVLVGLDTLVVTSEFTRGVRDALAPLGVAAEHVLLGASHTHAGPDVFAWWEGTEAAAPVEQTLEAAVSAATEALARLQDADLSFGVGSLDYASVNRRDEKSGPLDGSVSVLRASSAQSGAIIALTVVYACHPVTLDYANLAFSADYVGPFRRLLSAAYGGAGVLFLNGAAGNINPARFPYEQRENIYIPQTLENYPVYWGGFEDAERLGRTLAGEAVKAVERALPVAGNEITGGLSAVALPLKQTEPLTQFLDFMSFRESYREHLIGRDELETEVQVVRVGDVTFVGLPGEPFVELGLELKARAGGSHLAVVGFANDDVRYVMTDDAYVEGQYETVGTPLEATSAERVVAAAAGLIESV